MYVLGFMVALVRVLMRRKWNLAANFTCTSPAETSIHQFRKFFRRLPSFIDKLYFMKQHFSSLNSIVALVAVVV